MSGLSDLGMVSRTLRSPALGSQHRQGPRPQLTSLSDPSLGLLLSCSPLSGSFRGRVNHLGFCWPCVVRVINTLRIELKLVTGTNPVYSIVIHLFNKYFLNPIRCQTLCKEKEKNRPASWHSEESGGDGGGGEERG